jgi:ABC-type transport system involved in multi-copper enzyme maturation permease subunit
MSTPVPMSTPIAGPVTLLRVVRSEWTKFRSLRSTWWSIVVTILAAVGVGVLTSASAAGNHAASAVPVAVAGRSELGGLISQLAVGVLAVLFISGEYGTGMIRSSMIAVPRRLPVLWAKLGVFVAVVLPVTLVSSLAAFALGQVFWRAHGRPPIALTDPGVARVVFGAAVCIMLTGLIALAIGTLVRNTAAGITTMVGLYFVLPILAGHMPQRIAELSRFLPSNASGAVWNASISPISMTPTDGFILLCVYTVVLCAAAAWRLRHGDV